MWISVKDKQQPLQTKEPVVYARPRENGKWSVGIAYWTVSEKWNPEMESTHAPGGFTHWMELPDPPGTVGKITIGSITIPKVCEDHPDREATHIMAGITLLCDECAEKMANNREGFVVQQLPKDQ